MSSTPAYPKAHVIASDAEAICIAHTVAATLAPGASARDRAREIPRAELDALSASGLLAITIPRSFGGAGVTNETIATVFQILAAADPAIAQLPQSHFVFLNAIRHDGTPDQKAFFFREILAGARLGNAQAERGSASALDLKTRLLRTLDGDYRLNGTKHYCTGAITAHWIPVAAIDDAGRLVLAYVPRDADGVEVLADWNALGQRVTFSGTSTFKDVAVPAEHVVPHWKIFDRPTLFHSFAQLLHTAIDVGIAQAALDDTAAAIRSRKRPRLGAPSSVAHPNEDPLVIHRFGQLNAKFHAAEGLLLRAARLLDAATPSVNAQNAVVASVAVSEAKAFVEDVVIEITNDLFALVGTSAADESLNLDRHWRNARVHTVHDANQWRYHAAGNYALNGVPPEKPLRRLVETTPDDPITAAQSEFI